MNIVITAFAILLLILFFFGCLVFAKWYIFGSAQKDEPQIPLMSQMTSYYSGGGSSEQQCSPQVYHYQPSTERVIERYEHTYYQPAPTMPVQPFTPQPQSAAPVVHGEDRQPAQPETPVYQPVTLSPDYSVAQPLADDPYSEPGPVRNIPETPYYQAPTQPAYTPTYQPPVTPAPVYEPYQQLDFSAIPPYEFPSLENIYQGPVSDHDTAPDPDAWLFEENTAGVIGMLPIEPALPELPEIFEMPQASYPMPPIVVDADLAEQE
jgi:hypothetical protein